MSAEANHICEEFVSDRRKMSKFYRNMKGDHKLTSKSKVLFTCGACLTKFRTVCRLHIHLEGHQEGGSYTFDHITKTGFPKYDSVCAYTQVEQKLVVLIAQNTKECDREISSVKGCGDKIKESHCEATRKSKRIALRQNKSTMQAKFLETEIVENESDVNKISVVKDTGQEQTVFTAESEDSETLERQKGKKITNQIKCNSPVKKRKAGKARLLQASEQNDFDASKTYEGEKNLSDVGDGNKNLMIQKSIPTDEGTKVMLNNKKIVEQKTDEITASEALIAISKSVNDENITDMTKDETGIGRRDVTIHLSRLRVSSETNADTSSADLSGDEAVSPDVNDESLNEREQSVNKNKTSKTPDAAFSTGGLGSEEESMKHSLPPQEQSRSDEKIGKRECPVCGKLGTRAMLSYHRYLHKEEKEQSCDKCGKQFQHPSCLKVHLRIHEEKLYKCEKCPAKFSRSKYLETHMLKHSGEKPYMCENCGKAYRDEMHLKRHIKHVHNQIRNFECDICKERFFRTDHLKCHRMRHFEPGLRCSFCQRKFKLPADLKRHLVVHTGEKNWYCHLCGHGFRYPVPYYNHMKKKHDIERTEAGLWKKKMIEENKRQKEINQTPTASLHTPEDNKNPESVQNTIVQSVPEVSVEYTDIPDTSYGRKMYVEQETRYSDNSVDTSKACGSDQVNFSGPRYKVLKNDSVSTTNNTEKTQDLYMQARIKGYRFFRLSNLANNRPVKVLSNLGQEIVSSEQGLHFPLQDAYPVAEDAGTEAAGIVGFEDETHLQDDQMVVMGEKTVTEDIGVLSDLGGENMEAVMFIDDNECAGEVVIDQETII